MLTWEHADKLLANEIIYIFNEFELFIDEKDIKVIDHLNETMVSKDLNPLRNLTDGMKTAISGNILNIPNRVKQFYNNNDFIPVKYFVEFNRLKNKGINIFNNCIFSETVKEAINDKRVMHYREEGIDETEDFVTIYNFRRKHSTLELRTFFQKKFEDVSKMIVIVDTLLPKEMSENIEELGIKTVFIGREDVFKELKTRIPNLLHHTEDCYQYFFEIHKYATARNSMEKIKKIVKNEDVFNKINELNSSFEPGEFNNFLDHRCFFNMTILPYVIIYIMLHSTRKMFDLKRIFKNIDIISGDFLEDLKNWADLFIKYEASLYFNKELLNILNLNTEEKILSFFEIISKYECYNISDEEILAINNYLEDLYDEDLRELFELKLLELIINTDKIENYALLLKSNLKYGKEVVDFYEDLIQGKEEKNSSFPKLIESALSNYRANFELISNSEWHHEDGYNYNFSTKALFPSSFRYKNIFQDNVTMFKEVRPFITNEIIYYVEKNQVKIYDLAERKALSCKIEEEMVGYSSYDSKLIYSTKDEVYILDEKAESVNLDVIVDHSVFKNIRFREGYVYYFNGPTTFVCIPIDIFMSGNATIFDEYDIVIPKVENIIDLIVLEDYAYWMTNNKLYGVNINNHETFEMDIEMISLPKKLFPQNDQIVILSEDSVYVYYEQKVEWVADVLFWNKYTCYGDYLILTHNKLINIVNIKSGKQQLVISNLIDSVICDIICTKNQIIFITYSGDLFTAKIVEDVAYKNGIEIEIKKVNSIGGEKSLLAYFKKYLSIYNKREFVIYSA